MHSMERPVERCVIRVRGWKDLVQSNQVEIEIHSQSLGLSHGSAPVSLPEHRHEAARLGKSFRIGASLDVAEEAFLRLRYHAANAPSSPARKASNSS
jgi:hypothetical protein